MKEKVFYSLNVNHYEGLSLKENANCILKLTNYDLKLCDIKGRQVKSISLKNITNVAIISDKELVEKDKSVIARGIVGNVLFGGAGLILGGLSGIGTKKVNQNIDYLIINYKENSEDKVINVYAKSGILNNGFIKGLNNATQLSKDNLKCPYCNKEINFADNKCPHCGKKIKDNKGLKVIIGVIVGVFVFIFLIVAIASNVSGGNSKEVNIIKRIVSVENDKANNINDILKSVGINEFDSMNRDSESLDGFEGVGSKGYRIKTNSTDNIILYLDSENNVICIRYTDKDYYRNGQVLNKFE